MWVPFRIWRIGMDAPFPFQDVTSDERTFLEACLARRREMAALGRKATAGRVLAECEEAVVEMAQTTARELLAVGIGEAVAAVEKKGGRPGCAGAAVGGTIAAPTGGRC
jgi:hypothetical protein